MGDGGTNEMTGGAADGAPNQAAEAATSVAGDENRGDGGPRELSRAAAVGATVLAALCGCAALLAVFHWLGWAVPGVGWIVAKAGIKLAVGGFAGLAVGAAWLRTRFRSLLRG
ncbi:MULTISPECIES: hypothetical protein [Kitasatospora]|uniref:Uncharacterized protein n=1 Tax=Kitasatospora cathayae TaxID=3004092 RepID=A0ABY7QDK2_9ACTN|nr:hypothetical protein [Kitasatospora sp. HUAS 3-15]WBP90839.1 hypothetical protein O1G21_36570 [Kitasatospora sp. HUAS 3-15]